MSTIKLPRLITQLSESIRPRTEQDRRAAQLMALALAAVAALGLAWRLLA